MAAQTWDFTYYPTIVPVTGVGNTDSVGVGSVSAAQYWDFTYWDGVSFVTGVGNTDSTGIGVAGTVRTTWYDITGSVSDAAAGAGNTTSAGEDDGASVAGLPTPVITLNVQMPPGTVVGAYLRHEWIGSEVPVRGAGSYPGPVFAEAVVNARGEVAFTLPPESYIAWAADFPLRRRFFVVTD